MKAPTDTNQTLTLYGKMLTFSRIKLHTADLDKIKKELKTLLGTDAKQIPVIIDSEVEQDLAALVDLFWSHGLQPIGVVKGVLDDAAKTLKLALFPKEGQRIERIRPKSTSAKSASAEEHTSNTMVYDKMVRSGQSINHVGGDLILTNSVNNGAEVITDNNLHIYGRAQGRLVAGATGDKNASIFCQRFSPSLVSVAGVYCLPDNIPPEMIDKPVQVSFKEGEGLVFTIMNNS